MQARHSAPDQTAVDEDGNTHSLWRLTDPAVLSMRAERATELRAAVTALVVAFVLATLVAVLLGNGRQAHDCLDVRLLEGGKDFLDGGRRTVLSGDIPWDLEGFDLSDDGKMMIYRVGENYGIAPIAASIMPSPSLLASIFSPSPTWRKEPTTML